MSNTLDHLRAYSVVVADTADIHAIETYQPVDATTNPSLVLKQAQTQSVQSLIDETRDALKAGQFQSVQDAARHLSVSFGAEIAQRIPGYVSTEVDARLSFDIDASVAEAHQILQTYDALGIARSRILIKLASTWEGIEAARVLESSGIGCNLTLLFSDTQAIAAAEANATLISPFVGRIYDWYVARGEAPASVDSDPGVLSVQRIHRLYKRHGVGTIVMGASFRTAEQVLALTGCDRLTISPQLLEELATRHTPCHPIETPAATDEPLPTMDRNTFLVAMAENPMATEKLADGITRFIRDQRTLESLLLR
jgi:transaldolase